MNCSQHTIWWLPVAALLSLITVLFICGCDTGTNSSLKEPEGPSPPVVGPGGSDTGNQNGGGGSGSVLFNLTSSDPRITFTNADGAIITSTEKIAYIRYDDHLVAKVEVVADLNTDAYVIGSDGTKSWFHFGAADRSAISKIQLIFPRTSADIFARICPGAQAGPDILSGCAGEIRLDSTTPSSGGYSLVDLDDADYWHVEAAVADFSTGGEEKSCDVQVRQGGAISTIQAGINAANPGDVVCVFDGTYPEQLVITKSIQLLGKGVAPPLINCLPANQCTDPVVAVKANDVTLKRLEITNVNGPAAAVSAIWSTTFDNGPSGLVVDGLIIHDMYRGIYWHGPDPIIKNSNIYHITYYGIDLSGPSVTGGLVTGNWIHDWNLPNKSSSAYGIWLKYARYAEVTYNYISGVRVAVGAEAGGPVPGGEIVIAHNTFDELKGDPATADDVTTTISKAVSLWGDPALPYDGGRVVVQDNLMNRVRGYAVFKNAGTINGSISVVSNLFYQNYYNYPGNCQGDCVRAFQWFGDDVLPQAGWDAPANGFAFTDNITTQDPLLTKTGSLPEEYYSLQTGSPACNAASDGTNIGAWQGECD